MSIKVHRQVYTQLHILIVPNNDCIEVIINLPNDWVSALNKFISQNFGGKPSLILIFVPSISDPSVNLQDRF